MPITNADHLCINCMREKSDGGVCPFCGFDEAQYEPSAHHLPPRSILGGKCLIGRVLGEGGFGITYMGWDLNLELKLAIKEYYPAGFVTRTGTATNTVTPYRGEKTEFFTTGRSRFINEAKTLAKYYTLPGIVSVRDFFLENGTAYIVMEFVEGETLKQRLARVGGKMDADEVFELVRPLLRSLSEMHASGLIHRDISPDNIMITPENNIKLIDFGAARDYLDSGNRSLSVMLKPGFAPEEQYFARGQQGPWTDIYALCATIYRAITGTTPPESVERLRNDTLKAPSALGIRISPAEETALLKGMAVSQEERWQTIPELNAALYGGEGSRSEPVKSAKPKKVVPPKADGATPVAPKEDGAVPFVSKLDDVAPVTPNVESGGDAVSEQKAHTPTKKWSRRTLLIAGVLLGVVLIVSGIALSQSIAVRQVANQIEESIKRKDFQEAMTLIQDIEANSPIYDSTLYQAALDLLDKGDYEDAAIARKKIVEGYDLNLAGLDDQIIFQRATALVDQGEYAVAEEQIAKIIDKSVLDVTALTDRIAEGKIRDSFMSSNISDGIAQILKFRMSHPQKAKDIINDFSSDIYDYAVSQYRSGFFDQSEEAFKLIPQTYQQAGDYQLLIDVHRSIKAETFSWDWSKTLDGNRANANALISKVGWEDSNDLILSRNQSAILFLLGRWSRGSSYFQITSKSGLYDDLWGYWNLTGFPSGTWIFEDSEFKIKNAAGDYKDVAKFTIIDRNTIEVYVQSKSLTYTLYRN